MAAKKRSAGPHPKRFSVTLDRPDYDALLALAERHKPPLTLQYVVNFAIQRLLKDADQPQVVLSLTDPTQGR
jgi:hypothetical protein